MDRHGRRTEDTDVQTQTDRHIWTNRGGHGETQTDMTQIDSCRRTDTDGDTHTHILNLKSVHQFPVPFCKPDGELRSRLPS